MAKPDQTTIKMRSYAGKTADAQSNLSEEQDNALELVKRTAQLQEEKSRSLEHQKTIAQLRENLDQAQAKSAEMEKSLAELEARVNALSDALNRISEIAAAGRAG